MVVDNILVPNTPASEPFIYSGRIVADAGTDQGFVLVGWTKLGPSLKKPSELCVPALKNP